jgi:hypothetical protein
MANTLTALAPTLFSAAKEVAAEPFGVVGAINTSFRRQGRRQGRQRVRRRRADPRRVRLHPANVPSTGTDSTGSKIDVTITKSRKVDWHLTGEQIRSLQNATINQDWVKQLVSQGMRTLRNECEVDAAIAVKVGASRAFGTAGTTPFASDLTALTNARKILVDNGAPKADLQIGVRHQRRPQPAQPRRLQNAYQAGATPSAGPANSCRRWASACRSRPASACTPRARARRTPRPRASRSARPRSADHRHRHRSGRRRRDLRGRHEQVRRDVRRCRAGHDHHCRRRASRLRSPLRPPP